MRLGTPRNPVLILLFSFLTCGLYYFYVIYVISAETKDFLGRATESNISPGMEVLLTLVTCGIWNLYWDYRMGKRMAQMCQMVGLPVTDNAVLYLILDIFGIGFINILLEQDTLNRIWTAARSDGPPTSSPAPALPATPPPAGAPDQSASAPTSPPADTSSDTWYSTGSKKPRQPRPPLK
ncbi:MAG TPA: DUF4234 domain-containing protein [Capsulimonadaceae bacterium]|nr:DUF4234 domain-containing protein [Capsulimonadaceae bacterium]